MSQITNVMRLLTASNIPYESKEYEVDEENLDALTVAKKIDFDPDRVFKTLVVRGASLEIYVFVIPGSCELDLKKASSIVKEKSLSMVKASELLSLTGYIRGGCSPIGMKKHLASFIDETANLFETISISAGVRGVQVIINPLLLKQFCNAQFADII